MHYYYPTSEEGTSSERHAIAKDAANIVIHTELKKMLMKLKKDLEEQGVEALREVYLAASKLEEENDEEKFDVGDFDSDLDCDSTSDITYPDI